MRIWDKIPPENLCRNHLLAEHRETLCIFSVITNNKKGYSNHPEVLRWKNHLPALSNRHRQIQQEASRRGYNFKDLPLKVSDGSVQVPKAWDDQIIKLKSKGCECTTEMLR